jgi:hypothetical protein
MASALFLPLERGPFGQMGHSGRMSDLQLSREYHEGGLECSSGHRSGEIACFVAFYAVWLFVRHPYFPFVTGASISWTEARSIASSCIFDMSGGRIW